MLLWNRLSTTTSACFTAFTSKANTTPKPGMTSWSLSGFFGSKRFSQFTALDGRALIERIRGEMNL